MRGYINFSFVALNLLHQVPDLEKSFIQMLQLLRPESRQRWFFSKGRKGHAILGQQDKA